MDFYIGFVRFIDSLVHWISLIRWILNLVLIGFIEFVSSLDSLNSLASLVR
jgi:hypothetical protein